MLLQRLEKEEVKVYKKYQQKEEKVKQDIL